MADMFRGRVLWFGIAPSPEMRRELRNRRLAVTMLADAPAADQLIAACGAVFSFDASNIDLVSALASELAPALVDHGLRIEILATGDGVLGRAQKALGEVTRTRNVHARTAPEPHELPERLARHEPGCLPNTRLEIQLAGNREPIRDQDIPIFQRAFHDCRKIVLSELGGGRSRARVFSVHATLENSVAGAWPQPFFVKLDSTDKIVTEAENYRSFAPFVPFGLRRPFTGVFLERRAACLSVTSLTNLNRSGIRSGATSPRLRSHSYLRRRSEDGASRPMPSILSKVPSPLRSNKPVSACPHGSRRAISITRVRRTSA